MIVLLCLFSTSSVLPILYTHLADRHFLLHLLPAPFFFELIKNIIFYAFALWRESCVRASIFCGRSMVPLCYNRSSSFAVRQLLREHMVSPYLGTDTGRILIFIV